MNTLFYGDNLDILRRYVKDESVDLIYLDPPFNSAQNYNVLFREHDGAQSSAQIKAFKDTWTWDQEAVREYEDIVEQGGQLSKTMQAFRQILGDTNMMAYLSMMAIRLHELKRVMKPTASMYLHCDSTASHYLKILMDAIFGLENFRNEIVWKRSYGHGDSKKSMGRSHDTILFYTYSKQYTLNRFYHKHAKEYIETFFRFKDERGVFKLENLTSPNPRPNLVYEYKGFPPPIKGWRVSYEKMVELDTDQRLYFPLKNDGRIMKKVYLHELDGQPMTDIWADIQPLSAYDAERLGYPTQKPLALLERIIKASSNEGDVVLDPFCGCGTTIDAAQKLNRRWIGIDITHLAISLIKTRLRDTYGPEIGKNYSVIGEPTSMPDAIALAAQDKFQFQYWALGLVGARPAEQKKGADKGIDGRLYFHDGDKSGKTKQVIFSVKGGHTDVKDMRDLRGVIERENAEIGALITLQPPTSPMRTEAASAGTYQSAWGKHAKLQIVTIEDLLDGKRIDMPNTRGVNVTFRQAPKSQAESDIEQTALLYEDGEDDDE